MNLAQEPKNFLLCFTNRITIDQVFKSPEILYMPFYDCMENSFQKLSLTSFKVPSWFSVEAPEQQLNITAAKMRKKLILIWVRSGWGNQSRIQTECSTKFSAYFIANWSEYQINFYRQLFRYQFWSINVRVYVLFLNRVVVLNHCHTTNFRTVNIEYHASNDYQSLSCFSVESILRWQRRYMRIISFILSTDWSASISFYFIFKVLRKIQFIEIVFFDGFFSIAIQSKTNF